MTFLARPWSFARDLYKQRRIIYELTRHDFRSRYLGSYLGIIWAFVHPTIYILLLLFVFQFAFKSQPVADVPFVLWLMSGIIPWFFFSDSTSSAANVIVENAFLVRKMSFSLGMLPIVKILSALVIHLFFFVFLLFMLLIYGFTPSLYWLQSLYYLAATVLFVLGLSWFTSAVVVFLRDMGQLVAITLQFLFWVTPVFWSVTLLPPRFQQLIKLNPVVYITQGYRESFVLKVWFWEHWLQTLYFWSLTGILLVVGAMVFRRLRPHFADVL